MSLIEDNYKLKAEKRDLEIEVRHLKEGMLWKNQEISNLKTKLRKKEVELCSLHEYLASHIAILSSKLAPPPDLSTPVTQSPDLSTPVTQSPSSETVLATNTLHTRLKLTDTPTSHPVSRSQPVLSRSAKRDDKICDKYNPVLVSDDEFTSNDLYQKPRKVKVSVRSPEASINSDLVKHKKGTKHVKIYSDLVKHKGSKQVNNNNDLVKHKVSKQVNNNNDLVKQRGSRHVLCPDCGRCLLRKNLAVHKSKWCKGDGVVNENISGVGDDCLGGGGNSDPVDKVNLKIRCVEGRINGVKLNMNLKVNRFAKFEKVMDLFSKRSGLALDRLELRCKGRVLGVEEEVRSTEGETVWVNVVRVKLEDNT